MRSRWMWAATLGTMASLGLAASAPAQDRPYVRTAPTTTGNAVVGSTLTSTGGDAGGPRGTTVGRAWLRCTSPTDEGSCKLIDGAWNTSTYKPTGDDVGKRLRSALYAYKDYPRDLVWKMSPATAAVTNPAPPPPKAPAPAPTPVPTPTATPVPPAPEPAPAPAPARAPAPSQDPRPRRGRGGRLRRGRHR